MLFGISATDPLTFLVTPAVMAGVAVLASLIPARLRPAWILSGRWQANDVRRDRYHTTPLCNARYHLIATAIHLTVRLPV